MTLFEKICALLLALEHDLRTPLGVLKSDLDDLKTEGRGIDRMARQVERILGVIPPLERIMTEVHQGEIMADITKGLNGNTWFVEQIRSLGVSLDGSFTQISLSGTELHIVFHLVCCSGGYCESVGRQFTAFFELFAVLNSNLPSYVLILDAIIEHLGWNLSLRIQK